jgi:hypothetical protein
MNSPVGKLGKLSPYWPRPGHSTNSTVLLQTVKVTIFQDCENFKKMLDEGEDVQLEELQVDFEAGTHVMIVEHFKVTVKRIYLSIAKVDGMPMPGDYEEECEDYDLYKIIGPDGKYYWADTELVEIRKINGN